MLDKIKFVSSSRDTIQHPLIYKHPVRHDDTVMLALGILSGQYLQQEENTKKFKTLSKEETQHIQGKHFNF